MIDVAERAKKQLSFEETMQELEEKVRELESGELSLEESLRAYEKAVELIVQCREALAQCSARITVLKKDRLGEIQEEDFLPRER